MLINPNNVISVTLHLKARNTDIEYKGEKKFFGFIYRTDDFRSILMPKTEITIQSQQS